MTPEMEELMAQSGYSYSAADLMASNIWSLVSSVLWLLAGIVGIKNCSRTDKAKICVVFGGLMIAEILAQAVFNLAGGAFAIVGTVINLIMPLLYFWGAMKNLQAGAAAEPSPVDGVADILEVSSEQMRRGVKRRGRPVSGPAVRRSTGISFALPFFTEKGDRYGTVDTGKRFV